jgi:hypothetical protein
LTLVAEDGARLDRMLRGNREAVFYMQSDIRIRRYFATIDPGPTAWVRATSVDTLAHDSLERGWQGYKAVRRCRLKGTVVVRAAAVS